MVDKKKEIVNICLETFVENGLIQVSMRDLGNALDMDPTILYYYFKNKEELVIACAEEAKTRIERELFGTALYYIENPSLLEEKLYDRADLMRPYMKFFVSVCASSKYDEAIQSALDALSVRYNYYVQEFADKLSCSAEEVAPNLYIVINTMLSYMLFGEKNFVAPQLSFVYNAVVKMLENKKLLSNRKNAEESTKTAG